MHLTPFVLEPNGWQSKAVKSQAHQQRTSEEKMGEGSHFPTHMTDTLHHPSRPFRFCHALCMPGEMALEGCGEALDG